AAWRADDADLGCRGDGRGPRDPDRAVPLHPDDPVSARVGGEGACEHAPYARMPAGRARVHTHRFPTRPEAKRAAVGPPAPAQPPSASSAALPPAAVVSTETCRS